MKYIVWIFLFSSLFWANPLLQYKGNNNGEAQREVKTKADFQDLVSSLESAINMGQVNPYSYYLGVVYLTDFKIDNGLIKKDIGRAEHYFKLSLGDGNYAASYQIAMIEISRKNYDSALFVLDSAIYKLMNDKEQDPYKSKYAASFLSTAFSTIVLEYKYKDREAVSRAIDLLEGVRQKNDTATILFILANLYNIDGKQSKANTLLSRSCNMHGHGKDLRLDALCAQLLVRRGNK